MEGAAPPKVMRTTWSELLNTAGEEVCSPPLTEDMCQCPRSFDGHIQEDMLELEARNAASAFYNARNRRRNKW